jgi:hypothetical protein
MYDYWNNYMMAAAAAAAAASGPQATPADTLRSFLPASTKKPPQWPPQESRPPQWAPQESQGPPAKKRKIIHQVFKEPLVVTNHQKIGHVPNGKGPIVYKEVADPADSDITYMMCGECDSVRLFRNLTALYKHRLKDCCTHSSDVEQVITTETPDEPNTALESMTMEAKKFLCQLSIDELTNQYKQFFSTSPPAGTLKDGLVEAILNHTLTVGEIHDTQPIVEETVQTCADIPPISIIDSAMIYLATLLPRMQDLSVVYPKLSPLMLAFATICDCEPSLSRPSFDTEVQTDGLRKCVVEMFDCVQTFPVDVVAEKIEHVKMTRVKRKPIENLREFTQNSSSDEEITAKKSTGKREIKKQRGPRARRSSRLKIRE